MRIVYIGGIGRSGSTLVDRLLGQVPGVCAIGELVYTWQRGIAEGNRCGCGEPFQQCPFWEEVLTAAFGGSQQVDAAHVEHLRAAVDRARFIPWLLAPSVRPAFRGKLDEYVAYGTRIYDAVRAVSGCEVIVDSSKAPSFAFCLRSSRRIDLRVVHVVRDSRAVAYSWTRKVARPETTGPKYMPRLRPARTAGQWNYQGYIACIRRCLLNTLVLIISLIVIAFLVILFNTHAAPTMAEWIHILLAAIGAPLLVRLICCAYE